MGARNLWQRKLRLDSGWFTAINPWQTCCNYYQGLYIIFQMDWKRYIITLAKILPSSLRPEVYPEMSDSTATILDWGAKTVNMAV